MNSEKNKMQKLDFDLLKLHIQEDIKPMSWICFKGENLHKIFLDMFIELQNHLNISKRELMFDLAKSIKCTKTCVSDRIYNIRSTFPIILVEALLILWKNSLQKNEEELINKKQEILKNTDFLVQNHPKSKQIPALKVLTIPFCELLGIHAADGTLLKRYSATYILKIIQKDKSDALIYSNLMKDIFNITTHHSLEKGYHCIRIHNKIVSRYFNIFFDFPFGDKSKTVVIPKIIQDSGVEYQKAFAKGVMTFEGSVERDGVVSYGGLSEKLRDQLCDIFLNCGLIVKKRNYKNKVFLLRTPKLKKQEAEKWKILFTEGTEKWLKLQDIINGYNFHVDNLDNALKIIDSMFPVKKHSLTSIVRLIIDKYSSKTVHLKELRKELKISKTTLNLFIGILNQMNILIPKRQGIFLNDETHKKIFNKINLKNKDLSKIFDVKIWNIKHWKDQSCSIPLNYIDKILSLANMDAEEIKNSQRQTYDGKSGYIYNQEVRTWKLPYRRTYKPY
jgi:predicted transcriptional regulator